MAQDFKRHDSPSLHPFPFLALCPLLLSLHPFLSPSHVQSGSLIRLRWCIWAAIALTSRHSSPNVNLSDLAFPPLGFFQEKEEEDEEDHVPTRTAQLAQVPIPNPQL